MALPPRAVPEGGSRRQTSDLLAARNRPPDTASSASGMTSASGSGRLLGGWVLGLGGTRCPLPWKHHWPVLGWISWEFGHHLLQLRRQQAGGERLDGEDRVDDRAG